MEQQEEMGLWHYMEVPLVAVMKVALKWGEVIMILTGYNIQTHQHLCYMYIHVQKHTIVIQLYIQSHAHWYSYISSANEVLCTCRLYCRVALKWGEVIMILTGYNIQTHQHLCYMYIHVQKHTIVIQLYIQSHAHWYSYISSDDMQMKYFVHVDCI